MLPPRARNSTKIDLTHEIRNSSWDKEKVMQNKERNASSTISSKLEESLNDAV